MEEKFMTTNELAEIMRISPATVRRWALTGRIPAIRIGREWRISAEFLKELKEAANKGRTNA